MAAITQASGYNTLTRISDGWSDRAEERVGVDCHDDGFAHVASGCIGYGSAACCRQPARRAYRGEPGVREIRTLQGAGQIRRVGAVEGRDRRRRQGRGVCLGEHGTPAGAGGSEKERAGRAVRAQQIVRAGSPRPHRDAAIPCSSACSTRRSNSAPRPRKPIRPAITPSRPSARPRLSAPNARSVLEKQGAAAHRRRRQRRAARPDATRMAGISPKAAPTFSSPIAPPRAMRAKENPGLQTDRPAGRLGRQRGLWFDRDGRCVAQEPTSSRCSSSRPRGSAFSPPHGFSAPGLSP